MEKLSSYVFILGLITLITLFSFMQDTHAYVIKSGGSGFSMNDIIELCSYGIGIGVVLVIVGMFTESKSIKDFGIRIIVIVISPIVLFLAFALFGYIVNQFS